MNLSVVILPAKVLADGTHKIRVAISHNSNTRYFVTRFVVPSTDCVKKGVVTNKVPNASYINQQLRAYQSKIYKAYDEIEDAECYSCSQLVQLINNKINSKKPISFVEIADEWLLKKKSTCCYSTYKLYENGVQAFVEYAGNDFVMSLLTPKIVWEYDSYLIKKYSTTTIDIKMSALRGVTNLAVQRRYVSYDVNPFSEYKTRCHVVRDCVLPITELRKFREYHSDNPHKQRAVDLMILSFYMAGMNVADLMTLDFSDDVISFIRYKTKNRRKDNLKTEFTIQPEARSIINKYIGKDGHLNLSLTIKGTITREGLVGETNRLLKVVAKEVHCNYDVIYYCARKTFAQIGFLLNIQERVIAYCIGDSTNKKNDVLSHYVRANKQLADDCIRKVLDFFASDKTEDDLSHSESGT